MNELKHYAHHVDWYFLALIYGLFTWGLWGNPKWWAGAIAGVVIPPVIAAQGHLLYCRVPASLKRNQR